jgi:SAM-dependent methyltransferase
MNETSSAHYLGDKGKKYFTGRFTEQQEFGRIYQSRYFAPYCGPESVVLDFGCGDGTILRQLKARKKIGIEVNPECHKKLVMMNESLDVPIQVHERIDDIPDQSVNVVVSNHCLEHVPHPLQSLMHMKRVLASGGSLVMVVPLDDWRSANNRRWARDDKDFHLYTWSPMNIGNLLTEAGFSVNEITLHTFAWTPKLFWTYKYFGNWLFRIACHVFGFIKNRREILCIAKKP